MKELLFALASGLLGLALCFAGYRLARIIITLWGLFAGFTLGAAAASDALNKSFIATTMGIVIGVVVGLVFAALAYFFFGLAVVLFSATIGYWIGTSIVMLFGFDRGFLTATVGIIAGAIAGIIALFMNAPKYFLIVITAVGGSVAIMGGILLLFHKITIDAFDYAAASQTISQSWLLIALTFVLSAIGIAYQVATNNSYTLEEWGTVSEPKHVKSKVE